MLKVQEYVISGEEGVNIFFFIDFVSLGSPEVVVVACGAWLKLILVFSFS